jgi:hypothetical protein
VLREGRQWSYSQPCFPMVPADVDSPEFCLGLQTLLSLKVRLGPDPKMLGQVEGSGWKPGSGWQD